jgi:hypothetical protein
LTFSRQCSARRCCAIIEKIDHRPSNNSFFFSGSSAHNAFHGNALAPALTAVPQG